jgi:hypothetical protein
LVAVVLIAVVLLVFRFWRGGVALRATASDPAAAYSMGINVPRVFSLTWVVSAMIAAVSGIIVGSIGGISSSMGVFGLSVLVVVIVGISLLSFAILHVIGDPVLLLLPQNAGKEEFERYRRLLGLDQPLYVQYWKFASRAVQGDFGTSWYGDVPAFGLVLQRMPPTIYLTFAGLGVALLIALPHLVTKSHRTLLTEILVWALFAVSFDVLYGYTGLPSFGHSAFFGVGAYGPFYGKDDSEHESRFLPMQLEARPPDSSVVH